MDQTQGEGGQREINTAFVSEEETPGERATRLTEDYKPHDALEEEALKDPAYAAHRKQLREMGIFTLDTTIPPAV